MVRVVQVQHAQGVGRLRIQSQNTVRGHQQFQPGARSPEVEEGERAERALEMLEATLLGQLAGIGCIFGFVFAASMVVWLALRLTGGGCDRGYFCLITSSVMSS